MIIREITVGELPGFIASEEYRRLEPKPVTKERAVSQFHNPRANPADTALVYAAEGDDLLGFVGLLPDFIHGNPSLPASSNTGWWVHSEKGRSVAMLLFARAFQGCNRRMFLTDATLRSKEILQRTGWFHFSEPVEGVKVILRFYFGKLLRKRSASRLPVAVADLADSLLNGVLSFFFRRFPGTEEFQVTAASAKDEKVARFIRQHNQDELIARGSRELEWILQYPWLQTGDPSGTVHYPFSHYTKSFRQQLLAVTRNGQLEGVALFSVRDNHASLPCFYAPPEARCQVQAALLQYLLHQKADSLTVFHPAWVAFLKTSKIKAVYWKKLVRYSAVSGELLPLREKFPVLQDGDGDVIFT